MTRYTELIHELTLPTGHHIAIEAEMLDGIMQSIHALPCLPDGSRDAGVEIPGWQGQQDAPIVLWERA